jgi:hypothetical protein
MIISRASFVVAVDMVGVPALRDGSPIEREREMRALPALKRRVFDSVLICDGVALPRPAPLRGRVFAILKRSELVNVLLPEDMPRI